jgi:3-hydroxybutyryl-CoA dehydratase
MTPATLKVGSELRTAPREMTRERMRWYVDAQPTVAHDDGRIHTQEPTIHDDDGIIADGMISTNWIMGLLLDTFGTDFLHKGKLRTKYIAPIYEDQVVISRARVTAIEQAGDTTTYRMEVWCEDDTAKKLTVGEAVAYTKA